MDQLIVALKKYIESSRKDLETLKSKTWKLFNEGNDIALISGEFEIAVNLLNELVMIKQSDISYCDYNSTIKFNDYLKALLNQAIRQLVNLPNYGNFANRDYEVSSVMVDFKIYPLSLQEKDSKNAYNGYTRATKLGNILLWASYDLDRIQLQFNDEKLTKDIELPEIKEPLNIDDAKSLMIFLDVMN